MTTLLRESSARTEVAAHLRAAGIAEVDDSPLTRHVYSSDASLYRVEPTVVVRPRHVEEVLATVEVARTQGVPLTPRGAGTSLAGNAVGTGIVLDLSRHLNRVLEVDGEAGTARVEPGVVHAVLQRQATAAGRRFGPDPSTHTRCTIGGMIGNNACGSRALGYGRTSDNVLGLDLVTGTGGRLATGTLGPSGLPEDLARIVRGGLGTIRTEFGRTGRQISGYSLEHLLPERGADLTRMLVGTEGTLGVVVGAQVRLVRDAPLRIMVVLAYPSMPQAADAVTAILPFDPITCEGLDARIVEAVRARRGPAAVPPMPTGASWLLVELTGDEPAELAARAAAVVAAAGPQDSLVVRDADAMARLWRIREDGSGLVARLGAPAHAGWEDAAVPPEHLGAYLREFEHLLAAHLLTGVPYGHFGDGCIHVRIDFPFDQGTGVFRTFLDEAARLAASYGGSMSGEHGDGRARSALLPHMYSPAALELFGQVKHVFDPGNLLNPGVIVDPVDPADDIRVDRRTPYRRDLAMAFGEDAGDLSLAVHRCTGVGKCRAEHSGPGQVMCPSYLATREEQDSTRGRARILQEAVAGHLGPRALGSPEVLEALDLCLSCKGCSADCPSGVDMAAYKATALHEAYRGRIRPRQHYAMGQLPRWARLASLAPRLVNALTHAKLLHPLLTTLAGVDRARSLPRFAERTFTADAPRTPTSPPGPTHGEVVLFVDSFTEHFTPAVGEATVRVLTEAGWSVVVPDRRPCCGLTWVSTGQLDGARRRMQQTVDILLPHVRAGRTVVGMEPSCTATLRSDLVELLDTDEARELAAATRTLAETLAATPGYQPPPVAGQVVAQPHCHHHAVMTWNPDAALLERAGADLTTVGGCCGLAGNFGVEVGHHDISLAVADQQLVPALDAHPDATVLADGFSCRFQLDHLGHSEAVHLAQLLDPTRKADS